MVSSPKILRLALLFISLSSGLFICAPIFACCACWELKGISVILEDGSAISGYVGWNEECFREMGPNTDGKFPDVLLELKRPIYIDTELEKVNYPFAGAVVALKEPSQIALEKIIQILPKPGPFEGYKGAGAIPVVSTKVARLLQSKPNAICEGDDGGVATIYWIAYNERVSQKDIDVLCNEPWIDLIDNSDRLQESGIFRLIFAYD